MGVPGSLGFPGSLGVPVTSGVPGSSGAPGSMTVSGCVPGSWMVSSVSPSLLPQAPSAITMANERMRLNPLFMTLPPLVTETRCG
ncbi:MAG: hypothetical protein ISR64_02215 [Deltaproteobacteria bacterium]|nr:hypothetical protein [Deltaproteobacteria bacterium]